MPPNPPGSPSNTVELTPEQQALAAEASRPSDVAIAQRNFEEGFDDEPLEQRWARGDRQEIEAIATQAPYFAPASKTQVREKYGVRVTGDWWSPYDGLARATRGVIQSLMSVGMPVRVQAAPIPDSELAYLNPSAAAQLVEARDVLFDETLAELVVCVPGRSMMTAMSPYGEGLNEQAVHANALRRSRMIVIAPIERDCVSEYDAELMKQAMEVWAICPGNAAAYVRSGVPAEKVRVIPHAISPTTPLLSVEKPARKDSDPYIFYTIGKWEARKGQVTLLRALMEEFTPEENFVLCMKTHSFGRYDGYPTGPFAAALELLKEPVIKAMGWTREAFEGHFVVRLEEMTDAQLHTWHTRADCYVSAAHGEAWDWPAFDAWCAGNRIVSMSPWGHEWYTESWPPSSQQPGGMGLVRALEPVHPGYNWNSEAKWHSVSKDMLKTALRRAYAEKDRLHTTRQGWNPWLSKADPKGGLAIVRDEDPEMFAPTFADVKKQWYYAEEWSGPIEHDRLSGTFLYPTVGRVMIKAIRDALRSRDNAWANQYTSLWW